VGPAWVCLSVRGGVRPVVYGLKHVASIKRISNGEFRQLIPHVLTTPSRHHRERVGHKLSGSMGRRRQARLRTLTMRSMGSLIADLT
jgi:hypothetical protein